MEKKMQNLCASKIALPKNLNFVHGSNVLPDEVLPTKS